MPAAARRLAVVRAVPGAEGPDAADVVGWLGDNPQVNGVFNLGSGQARTFRALAEATFQAVGRQPDISYVDMPEVLRGKYQYFTEARMDRVRALGFGGQSTPLEEGVRRYVQSFLSQPDPYR